MASKPRAPFLEWVRAFGIHEVAVLCGVSDRAVYHWLDGQAQPSHASCLTILQRAKRLSYADIVGGAQ